ncbi:MAG: hypothetical protein IPP91_01200 [Betaproteobacteria bacterium]|nr:hypothetical protein [Betaproteobacteria bacterium]
MMRSLLLAAALLLGGCATTYQLTLMPRDSGKLYQGLAEDSGGSEGGMSITIEGVTYSGSWVEVVADRTTGYVSGGYGYRRGGYGGGFGMGGVVSMDNPQGGEAKALLRSADGAGLRCELRGGSGRTGGGVCRDDKGLEYDVQIRPTGQK